jgi:hypothetical protein
VTTTEGTEQAEGAETVSRRERRGAELNIHRLRGRSTAAAGGSRGAETTAANRRRILMRFAVVVSTPRGSARMRADVERHGRR